MKQDQAIDIAVRLRTAIYALREALALADKADDDLLFGNVSLALRAAVAAQISCFQRGLANDDHRQD